MRQEELLRLLATMLLGMLAQAAGRPAAAAAWLRANWRSVLALLEMAGKAGG